MNEKTLLRVCLIGFLLSITVLYFLVLNLSSEHVKIGEITKAYVGKVVNISGMVENLYKHKNGHMFFDLKDDTGSIKIVLWDTKIDRLTLSGFNISKIRNGVTLQIVGTVEVYRNELEIIPLGTKIKFI